MRCYRTVSSVGPSQDMLPSDNGSAEKRGKNGTNPLTGIGCPLTTRGLISVMLRNYVYSIMNS